MLAERVTVVPLPGAFPKRLRLAGSSLTQENPPHRLNRPVQAQSYWR